MHNINSALVEGEGKAEAGNVQVGDALWPGWVEGGGGRQGWAQARVRMPSGQDPSSVLEGLEGFEPRTNCSVL